MSCQPHPPPPRSAPAAAPVPAPVRSGTDALRVLLLATPPPLAAETLAFFLDDEGRGGVITIVSDTTDPATVLPVAECLCRAAEGVPSATALVRICSTWTRPVRFSKESRRTTRISGGMLEAVPTSR